MKNPFAQLKKMKENIGTLDPVYNSELLMSMNQRANELQRECETIKRMRVTYSVN